MKTKETLLAKVIQLNEEKKFEEVDELLTDELLAKYKHVPLYAEKVQALWRLKKYEDCENLANYAYELDYNNAKINTYLGAVNRNKKEYEKAISFYDKAIAIDPLYSQTYNGLGNVYYVKKEYEKAIEYYEKSIELDPLYSHPYNGLGNVYSDKKEYEKAIEYFEKSFDLDPLYSHPYNGLGTIYGDKKEYENAIKSYEKSIELDPLSKYPYNNLGIVYYDKKEYENAIKSYEKSIELDPLYSAPHFNLGLVYFDQKKYEKAKLEYQKSIELKNDSDDYFSKIAKSRLEEIEIILKSKPFENITDLVNKIKELLLFKKSCITHYTGISTAQFLLLKKSPFRLSEGAFLNDTSEGKVLFEYLNLKVGENNLKQGNSEYYTEKPFVGSFVHETKNNDLTLWRMYGKEALEEAKGCAITLDAISFKNSISDKLNLENREGGGGSIKFEELEFYNVSYQSEAGKFMIPGAKAKENEELEKVLIKLKKEIESFITKDVQDPEEKLNITELLNEIAYLFKNGEYQYENEVRLLFQEGIGFEKHIDSNYEPPRVYIELVPIEESIRSITIGPKVEKAEEWASAFHYYLKNNDLEPEILISKLPFK